MVNLDISVMPVSEYSNGVLLHLAQWFITQRLIDLPEALVIMLDETLFSSFLDKLERMSLAEPTLRH